MEDIISHEPLTQADAVSLVKTLIDRPSCGQKPLLCEKDNAIQEFLREYQTSATPAPMK